MGHSLAACCSGDRAAQTGSYRFLRNDAVDPEAIAEGGFNATARQIDKSQQLLAIEDTTTASYRHAAADERGVIGSEPSAKSQGYRVHLCFASRT